jgi:hypothetical protein
MGEELAFRADLWQWKGDDGWHFVTLPADVAADVRETAPLRRGFGSVRVRATVGEVTWRTSLFPEAGGGSYVLPVKQQVRRANDLLAGDPVDVRITVEES